MTGDRASGDRVTIAFAGRPVEARAGESLAAGLTAAGITTLRTTRDGRARGMFCGMGVCQDCLVEVDGRPNQRACMVKAADGMAVRPESHRGPLPAGAAAVPDAADAVRTERPEVLVIGGGPGGLSAAIAARRAGCAVVLLDERAAPGGQYYKPLAVAGAGAPDGQHRAGAALVAEARQLGVELRPGVLVWGAFAPRRFTASGPGGAVRFEPAVAIVATGAYERPWPVPGWTAPGVMTTGAAQTLWRTARRLPGRRVLIAGNGPLNLQLAAELAGGGAAVAAVAEAAPPPSAARWRPLLAMALAAPGLVADGLRYHAARRRGGGAMLHGVVVTGVEPAEHGLAVTLGGAGGGGPCHRFVVDALCLGYGFEPSNELLRALGCGHDFDPVRHQLVTRRDPDGRTDVPGVLALGDCTGLGGAQAALAEGTLAGLAAALDLGRRPVADGAENRARARLRRHRAFQRALWALYEASPFDPALATPDTVLCRCEEVTFGAVEGALAEGLAGIGAVKRRTRVGMGRCQGRYCAPVLDGLMAARAGRARDERSGFAPRVPVRPVTIEELARRPP